MWISNVQTLPSDFFPVNAVGTVAGLGGMAAGIASIFFIHFTAPMVARFGYSFVLTVAGAVPPIAAVLLFVIAGPIHRLEVSSSAHSR
jgi:ACS family hexuronate transporter-like MFS transporter